jgi:predicted dehydrogenase
MTLPINVAVVGTGFGQKVHIPGLQAHSRTQVIAVYNQDFAKAQKIAQTYNIPYPCVPMRERKECHCMLFLTPDNDFAGEKQDISLEEIKIVRETMG